MNTLLLLHSTAGDTHDVIINLENNDFLAMTLYVEEFHNKDIFSIRLEFANSKKDTDFYIESHADETKARERVDEILEALGYGSIVKVKWK